MTFWNVNIANGNHDTPEKISITRVANFTGFAQSELGFTWQKILRGEFGRWGNITAEAKWKLWIMLTSLVMWVLLWRTGWCSWIPLWFGSFGAPYFAAVSCEFSSCHHCCKHIIFFFFPKRVEYWLLLHSGPLSKNSEPSETDDWGGPSGPEGSPALLSAVLHSHRSRDHAV